MIRLFITTAVCGLALIACSSDDSVVTTPTPVTPTPLTSINGRWSIDCVNFSDEGASAEQDSVLTDGSATSVTNIYRGDNCVPANFRAVDTETGVITISDGVETETSTYTLGSLVTVDGSVLGITNATQFTTTNTTVGDEDFGEVEFDLVAISGDQLVVGDTDGANDGSTEALRAQQLEDILFFKN